MYLELVDESLYEWNVKIIKLDSESPLAQDLKELAKKNGQDHILLSMTFKDSFPFSPPFVRVVSPVILGGYIMNGGAICTELVYIIKNIPHKKSQYCKKGSVKEINNKSPATLHSTWRMVYVLD